MRDAGCTHVIMEVSSHSLVLDRVHGIRFAVGAFTNLTQDHLDFHKTMENYRQAKAILFTVSDRGVINLDDAAADKMLADAKCPCLTYSCGNEKAGLCATNLQLHADGVEFDARYNGETAHVRLPIPGHFSVENALNALGMVSRSACRSQTRRSPWRPRPASRAAWKSFRPTRTTPCSSTTPTAGRRGERAEAVRASQRAALSHCSAAAATATGPNASKMGRIAADLADFCIVTSDNPRTEEPKAIIDDILGGHEGQQDPDAGHR